MKRIQAACLLQTIHFQLKEDLGHNAAVQAVKNEVRLYLAQLERSHIKYVVTEEQAQPDGSIILCIKKQYNHYNCDPYIN